MSRLRVGMSEGESDALFGKGSGSHSRFGSIGELRNWHLRRSRCGLADRKFAEQAVTLQAVDPDRENLSDDLLASHYMRGLQIGGTANDLAGIAG
jgi:hypothetical protein